MTDDDAPFSLEDSSPRDVHYDFLKWLTTLALVSIGGVFSLLSQADFKLPPRDLLVILGALALAALAGLSGAALQIGSKSGKPWLVGRSRRHIEVAMLALGIGAGWFVATFVNKLIG